MGKEPSDLLSNLLTKNGYKEYSIGYISSKEIISDSLMRRAYSIIYREKLPQEFIAACEVAAETYFSFIDNTYKGEEFLTLWLIEYWYQLLQARQIKYLNSEPSLGKNRGLKNEEIAHGLELLRQRTGVKYNHWCNFLRKQLQADWEFKFLLCYNARSKEYDDSKFSKFQSKIKKSVCTDP